MVTLTKKSLVVHKINNLISEITLLQIPINCLKIGQEFEGYRPGMTMAYRRKG